MSPRSFSLTALLSAAIVALALQPAPTQAANAPPSADAHAVCVTAARAAEREHGIAPHLLGAISLIETGRWSRAHKASLAWPWTVMAEGRGRYLPSKRAAIAEVRKLKARGIRNIDVGCFQVNLYYHGEAFDSLEQAFDPEENASYAAAFLASLQKRAQNWKVAVGRYHSWDKTRGPNYSRKVHDIWYDQRDQLVAAASAEGLDGRSQAEIERQTQLAADRAQRARERAGRALHMAFLQAQRDANRRFLEAQRKLQEARIRMDFERRKARVLAEYQAMKAERAAKRGS